MPEKKTLNEDFFYKGSSANLPHLHTCENKTPFWDFSQFAVTIYGLTLAWVTSENSTKQLECRLILTRYSFTGPYLLCYCVRSRLPLSVVPRQLLSAPFSNQLSSRVPLPLPATPRFQVQKPFVWFRAKKDKGIVCLAGHLYCVTK